VTAQDVALRAGVSRSAVSRSFTPGASVAAETRARVLSAAHALGYQPNLMARSLMTQRSHLIALIMGQMRNPFFTDLLEGFNTRLQGLGFQTLLMTADDQASADRALDHALGYRIDGALTVAVSPSRVLAKRCTTAAVPLVALDRRRSAGGSTIWIDGEETGAQAAQRFVAEGRRRLGLIEGHGEELSSGGKSRGFIESAAKLGVAAPAISYGHFTYEGGFAAMRHLLQSGAPPDGVFCVNDLMAIGALDAARYEGGKRVPEDVSLIGFGDIPAAAWRNLRLTTLRIPLPELLDAAVDTLTARIADFRLKPVRIALPTELIERSTTRALNAR
jgi:DNA-binding LacI/PurR family transcriptional regulator